MRLKTAIVQVSNSKILLFHNSVSMPVGMIKLKVIC